MIKGRLNGLSDKEIVADMDVTRRSVTYAMGMFEKRAREYARKNPEQIENLMEMFGAF